MTMVMFYRLCVAVVAGGLGLWGLGFEICGLGFRVWGLWCGIGGLGVGLRFEVRGGGENGG